MRYSVFMIVVIVLMSGFLSVPRVQAQEEYVLGPGDVLEISVWRDTELTKEVVVRPDGLVSFPLIGDIIAGGKTVGGLRTAIQQKIQEYVPDAPVSVLIKDLGSMKVYVVGKVNEPGAYLMHKRLSVIQLLAMAGGLNSFANEGGILVIREEQGQQKSVEFDYSDVSKGKSLRTNILLQPNDTVIVP